MVLVTGMIKKLVFLLLFAIYATSLLGEDKGLDYKVKELGGEYTVVGKQYAVFIAINRYQHWMPLKNPVKDARNTGHSGRKILHRRNL